MDLFLEDDNNFTNPEIQTTPNIEFQTSRFFLNEPMNNKYIPETCLFTPLNTLSKLKSLFIANIDIPILLYGLSGCGKLSAVLGLLPLTQIYLPYRNKTIPNPENIVNNIVHMKILDKEFNKIMYYDNLYIISFRNLNTNIEKMDYLRYIFKLSKTRSIDENKKIFILTNIEFCNEEQQRYICMILDKIPEHSVFILITSNLSYLNKKIKTFCACVNHSYLKETEFYKIFKNNYEKCYPSNFLSPCYITKYYEIYKNNNYNIGQTISQIKYILSIKDITIEKIKINECEYNITDKIAKNFIKKHMKLTLINNVSEVRKILYMMVSININLLDFSKALIRNLLNGKLSYEVKSAIINKGNELSVNFTKMNKNIIAFEIFVYGLNAE